MPHPAVPAGQRHPLQARRVTIVGSGLLAAGMAGPDLALVVTRREDAAIDEIVRMIILGVVEGVTEFLPISSTGHLIVTSELLGGTSVEGVDEIVIQLGAVLAVLWFYRSDLLARIGDLRSPDRDLTFWRNLVVAAIPAAILGLRPGRPHHHPPVLAAGRRPRDDRGRRGPLAGGAVQALRGRGHPGDVARPDLDAPGARGGRHPARGAGAGHVAFGLDHRGRAAGGARPPDRDGVLVLPGHPHPGRGDALLAGQEPVHAPGCGATSCRWSSAASRRSSPLRSRSAGCSGTWRTTTSASSPRTASSSAW